MAILRHNEQRRWHLVRYGPVHLVRHIQGATHGHRRATARDKVAAKRNKINLLLLLLGTLAALVIVMVLLSIQPLNDARQDLNAARALISSDLHNKALLTSANGRLQLQSDIGAVSKQAALAHAALTGSASLRLLGYVPFINTQRNGVIQLSSDVEQATQVASDILNALNTLVSNSHGTTVSLPDLAGLEFSVVSGDKDMAKLDRPASGLIGPIASARTSFDQEDAKILHLLSLSAQTIAFARPFLGDDGPQTYLIGGMNNAEMRDSGSVLSLDLLTTKNGTFSIEKDNGYGHYVLTSPANVALPAGTEKVFGSYAPTENWPNVDATADFALTGESMQAMWAQATGQHVDGVLGMDVKAVAGILKLTGPVLVPGIGEPVSAANVEYLLLDKEYQGLTVNDPQGPRRDMIAATIKAAVDQMKQEHIDIDAFANALSKDVEGRHLMVWSDVPVDEKGLLSLDAAGTLNTSEPDRTIHLAVENSTADKLDYFLGVHVTMKVTVDSAGSALINTMVSVHNGALPDQPPSYQYGPDGVNAFTPGQYVARIFYWGPKGSDTPSSIGESGLELAQTHFSLLPQQQNVATFTSVIPHAIVNGRLDLRLVPQGRVVPDGLTIDFSAPGWTHSGPTHVKTSWATTLGLTWEMSH
jgi:hypothetical protein